MMREQQRPDDESLDRALRTSFRTLQAARGPCPPAAQLVKYQAGELGPEENAAIYQHVVLCGTCELYIERLEEFDGAAVPAAAAEPVRRDVRRALQGSRFGVFGKPALGYAVALLLAYPAYRGVFPEAIPAPRQEVSRKIHPALSAVRVFELAETRPASESPKIELRSGEERFSLSLFVPGRKGGRYSAEIRDSAGATVGNATTVVPASLGAVTLLCERSAFQNGRYKLTVTESDPAGGAALRQFDYGFEVRLPARE
jgi:hypothetical protein